MNKVLALDPKAIESARDWEKIYPFVGQAKGLFVAKYPKIWIQQFLDQDIDERKWEFWDLEKIKEFLISLQESNSFVSLNSPYEPSIRWFENYSKVEPEKKENCIAYGSRRDPGDLKTLDELDSRKLFIDTTVNEKFTPKKLTQTLKIFLQNSPKIAIVDRHNYLTTLNGKPSLFVDFIKELLELTKASKCHEIIIYAKYDPDKYPYMLSDRSVQEQLSKVFEGCMTPTYGIKYVCCSEYQNNQDLHARKIITNHVVFLLSDSIAGGTYSQSITRVHDDAFRESNLKSWIDQEHGLDVKASGVFVNLAKTQLRN
ncbi:hypothetical protein G6660_09070 [Polynucleobacter paneuropaeus]|nr:hypothetical protein [Polynucleobacter paneuropaeus]